MVVTWWSIGGHVVVTWWSRCGHVVVTWWSRGGHVVVTLWSRRDDQDSGQGWVLLCAGSVSGVQQS